MMMPFQVRIERRLDRKWWYSVVTPLVSVVAALLGGAIFLAIEGFDPWNVYRSLFEVSFTTRFGFTDSVTIAIPLILTGLAAAIVFRMNLFNIGAEGQLYFGAIFGSWAGLALADGMGWVAGTTVVMIAAAIGGALWAAPAALFKAYFGVSEIITTLMLTFIALFFMRYLIFGSGSYWRDPETTNFPQGKKIPIDARFPQWSDTRLHWGLVMALLVVLVIWVLIKYTSLGFDMNVVGSSENSARYAGIPVKRTIIVALLISGALAGLAGGAEVAGRAYALDPNGLELGLGFTGIVVAALARYNPFGVVLVAIFLGGLRNAGIALQGLPGERIPVEVSLMLQGAILLFAIGGEVFSQNRLTISRTSRAGSSTAGTSSTAEGAAA
jgi:simple sugar transport system permease protein